MGTFTSIEEARDFFKGDRFATDNGMQIDALSEDSCICSMELEPKHRNALGGVMGGVTFTLADFAFAVIQNHVHKYSVAQQVNINHLSAPKGNRLIATAKVRKNGRTSTIVNVDVVDDTGRDIAQFTGTGYKLPAEKQQ